MADRLTAEFLANLHAVKQDIDACYVGFSGGLDSTVLLYLLARFRIEIPANKIAAIHIQHNLHQDCVSWSEHCQKVCKELDIPLHVIELAINNESNLESNARNARYDAFARIIQKDDVLLLAHHLQDQAETVLMRLLRGCGILGLSAIPQQRKLHQGLIIRPLLNISRDLLLTFAQTHHLDWIDDPSNQDLKFTRNLVRHKIIPKLEFFFPKTQESLVRASKNAADAQILLDELAAQDLQNHTSNQWNWLNLPSLDVQKLQQLSYLRQQNLLRYFLRRFTLMPDSKHWHGFKCLLNAKEDARPIWQLHEGKMLRANGKIWYLPNNWQDFQPQIQNWQNPQQPLSLIDNGIVEINDQLLIGDNYQIRYRIGGEKVDSKSLKKLLNEHKIPHFVRFRIPLLYVDDKLVACANIHTGFSWNVGF